MYSSLSRTPRSLAARMACYSASMLAQSTLKPQRSGDCLALSLALVSLTFSSGCVALNLPSDRYHDPGDRGGIFGAWETGAVDPEANATGGHSSVYSPNGIDHAAATIGSSVDCIGGESLSVDPFDTENGEYAKPPEPPEVPWPRFHPVPTRPVFGG